MSDVTVVEGFGTAVEIADNGFLIQFDCFEDAEQWVTTQMNSQREYITRIRDQVNELEDEKSDAKVELERIRQMARDLADHF